MIFDQQTVNTNLDSYCVFNKLLTSVREAIKNANIDSSLLNDKNLAIKIKTFGDIVLLSVVVFWHNKYYCFNYHPGRKDVTLTHTLDNCDMDKQLDESLTSLSRLYEDKNVK